MKSLELEERLINFSVAIIQLVSKFPNNPVGKHLGNQLLRSGTAPALMYGEAQGAESTADFLHKLKIALKELRESHVNLKINSKAKIIDPNILEPLLNECNKLISIFVTSCKTTQSKLRK